MNDTDSKSAGASVGGGASGKRAFDNDLYIELQSAAIRDRAKRFGNKLYLEIGGKLLQDLHAARSSRT